MTENRPVMKMKELIEFCKIFYEPHRIPLIVWGPTGVGKTDLMIKLAQLTGRILRIFYPAGMEPTDLSGLPFRDRKNIEQVKFHKTDMIDFKPDKKYLVFMDEMNRASSDMQQALLGLYNKKPYFGVHNLENSDLWICTAMNDSSMQKGVHVLETDDAFRTRAAQVILQPSVQEVGEYLGEIYGRENFIAELMLSPYVSSIVEKDFGDIYRAQPTYIMPTARNFEMAAKGVRNVSRAEIRQYFKPLQSILGVGALGAMDQYLTSMNILDPAALFTEDKELMAKLRAYANAPIDTGITKMLIDAYMSAVTMSKNKKEDEVVWFFRHLIALHTADDGRPAYREVIAAVYGRIRTDGMRILSKVSSKKEFMQFFKDFHQEVIDGVAS